MIGKIIISDGKEERVGEILFQKEDKTFVCKFNPPIDDPKKNHLSYFDEKTGFRKVFKCGRAEIDQTYKILEYVLNQ